MKIKKKVYTKTKSKKKKAAKCCNPKSLRRNPSDWKIKKALTPEELNTLFVISGKYESPNILFSAYNEDTEEWDMNLVAKAMIATLGDGGKKFQIPLIGGALERKIHSLFSKILEDSEKLDMNTQIDLHDSGI